MHSDPRQKSIPFDMDLDASIPYGFQDDIDRDMDNMPSIATDPIPDSNVDPLPIHNTDNNNTHLVPTTDTGIGRHLRQRHHPAHLAGYHL